MATISTHNGSSVSKRHNERDKAVCDKESHIDLSKPHENWINIDHKQAYDEIFGEALEKFNARQKRSDRRISSYYDHIRHDKKKHVAYEMIIGVYDTRTSTSVKRDILKKFVDTWSKRNPNLKLVGAYYHADEQGKDPHVHIDYIPVARQCKRGLDTQNALNKALSQQGFVAKSKSVTSQIMWERSENEFLEKLCNERGIEVEHDYTKRVHLDTDLYKKSMERSVKAEKLLEQQIDSLSKDLLPEEINAPIDEPMITKVPFKGNYVSEDDYIHLKFKYDNLKSFITKFVKSAVDTIAKRGHENANLKELNHTLERSHLNRLVVKLREENKSLVRKFNSLTDKFNNLEFDFNSLKIRYNKVSRDYQKLKYDYELTVKELNEYQSKDIVETVSLAQYNALEEKCDLLQSLNYQNAKRGDNIAQFVMEEHGYSIEEVEEIMTSGTLEQELDYDDWEIEY